MSAARIRVVLHGCLTTRDAEKGRQVDPAEQFFLGVTLIRTRGKQKATWPYRQQRKPIFEVELSGVFELRAATR
jgi:hypothetical protein